MITNIYNIFPKDIWISIIFKLPCKYIYNLNDSNYQFEKLCYEQNIIEKRKSLGFPRKSNHCNSYGVYNFKGNVYNNNGDIIDFAPLKIVMKNSRRNYHLVKLILDNTLDILYKNNIDLIKGDLIDFEIGDKSTFIFDGEKIVDTYFNHISIFPDNIDIINDNIFSSYWSKTKLQNFTFCFNNISVKDQLMNNIVYGDDIGKMTETSFISDKKTYKILFSNDLSITEINRRIKNDKMYLLINEVYFPIDNHVYYCK